MIIKSENFNNITAVFNPPFLIYSSPTSQGTTIYAIPSRQHAPLQPIAIPHVGTMSHANQCSLLPSSVQGACAPLRRVKNQKNSEMFLAVS